MSEKAKKKEEGITLKQELQVSYPKTRGFRFAPYLLEICLIFLIVCSTVGSFLNGCEIGANKRMLYGILFGIIILFYGSFWSKKWCEIFILLDVSIFIGIGYFYKKELADGLANILNIYFREVERYFNIKLGQYQVDSPNEIFATSLAVIYLAFFMTAIVTYVVRREKSVIILVLSTICIAFLPEVVGLVPAMVYRFCYFVGIFVYAGSNLYKRKGTEKKLRAQKRIQQKVRLYQFALMVVCFGLFSMILSETTYKEMTRDKSFKMAIQEGIRRGMDDLVRGTFSRGRVEGGINFGELGKNEGIEYIGDTKLKVYLEKKEFDPLYLRGYIGSVYENNGWMGLSKEAEAEKQRMEMASKIKVEDFNTAFLYYYLTMRKLSGAFGKTQEDRNLANENDIAYQGKNTGILIANLFPNFIGKVQVDNIAETYGTLFTPYYIAGNLLEHDGKLTVEGKKNKSFYEWNVIEEAKKLMDFTSDKSYNQEAYRNETGICFREGMDEIISIVEQRLGIKLEDYNLKEVEDGIVFGTIVDDLLECGTIGYGNLNLYDYKDVELKKMLQILKSYKEFRNFQLQYDDYARKYYLQVPSNLENSLNRTISQEKEKNDFYGDVQEEWVEDMNLYDWDDGPRNREWAKLLSSLLLVKKYLKENTEYTLKPGAVPEGEDLVEYFLYKNKKGYCSYYASSAVLLLRSLGIPARYVEGYMAGKTTLKTGKYENDSLVVEMTDENAHAWVEVYVDGFGWTPVEMTPGYSEGFEVIEHTENEHDKPATTPNITPTPSTSQTSVPKTEVKFTLPIIQKIKRIIRNIAIFISVLVVIWIRRAIVVKIRKKKETQEDYFACITFIYQEINRILSVKKHKSKEMSLRDWMLQNKEEQVEKITPEQWEELLNISNRCAFSNQPPMAEEVEWCRQLYHSLQLQCYKECSFWKRVYYRYIRVL